jgi:hypothetical protein
MFFRNFCGLNRTTQRCNPEEANVCLYVNAVHVQEGPLIRYASLRMTRIENLCNPLE